jgi:tetratricopeptide (TPR) repeat protein
VRRKLTAWMLGIACFGSVLLITEALDLPRWTPIAFVLAFPAYAFGLRKLAALSIASWERRIRGRASRGELPASPDDWLPKSWLIDQFFTRSIQLERAAGSFRDLGLWPAASSFYEAAHRSSPDADRPRLAREAWAALKKQRAERKPDWSAYLEDALRTPDPPYDLFEDSAEVLMTRGRYAEADHRYRHALEHAATERQRFKAWCGIAIACARDGRYGAADSALHEASEIMPTGDPGFQALYDRTLGDVASAKQSARSGQLDLVQLARNQDDD